MAKTASVTSIPERIKFFAEDAPHKEAFVFIDKYGDRMAFSRKDLWDRSQKFAAILKRQGIGKGDIVCNSLVNSPERVVTTFGTMTAGASTMHGQLLMAHGEDLIRNLKVSQCKAIIVDVGVKDNAWTFLERIAYKDEKSGEIQYKDLPNLTTVIKLVVTSDGRTSQTPDWLRGLDKEKETFLEERIQADDVAAVFNTSGTTGFSKLVPHTHGCLIHAAQSICDVWETGVDPIYYSNRSLGWYGGFPHLFIAKACTNVITNHVYGLPDPMAPHMVKIIEEEKCTHTNLAGVEVERILEAIDYKPLSHLLESVGVGGGPIATFIEKANMTITKQLVIVYGGTEFGIASMILLDKNSTYENYCTGPLIGDNEVKIRDNKMDEVKTGVMGEIYIRSSMLGLGYLNDPEKTKESFLEDGWFRTGDLGYQNEKGQLYVMGRKSNAIMKGSFIFYPGWLEAQILKCPGIQSVAVIGVPDPILHEEICLCLIPTSKGSLTEAKVKEFCQSLFLTSEKEEITPMPKYILFFEEFPFNANLKVDVKNLKGQACARLNIKQ